jgi:hypothetical protein
VNRVEGTIAPSYGGVVVKCDGIVFQDGNPVSPFTQIFGLMKDPRENSWRIATWYIGDISCH